MEEDLFGDIAATCFRNDLSFEYHVDVNLITVSKESVTDAGPISQGYIKNWEWEKPEDALNRILEEVNEYLEGK